MLNAYKVVVKHSYIQYSIPYYLYRFKIIINNKKILQYELMI